MGDSGPGRCTPAHRREPSPGLGLDSPLSTSLPFLAIAVFPMTRETASRGDGGEGTGAVPPPRSLQQLPLLLSSRRSRSAASGRAEQPGVGKRCGELSGSDRDCGGGGARTLPLPEPALQARPRHRAPPAAAHPERDLGTGASPRAGGRTGSDVGRKPPGRRELFCAGLGW